MENGIPPIARLRAQIEGEEFDYLALLRSLQDYAYPRDKITTMLRRGDIVRVKKGIYVFGDAHARRPYSREILANMIYGPSYVSLDSALQYHGLIPEGVEAVTSMTMKRARRFATPTGLFIYRPATPAAYPWASISSRSREAPSCSPWQRRLWRIESGMTGAPESPMSPAWNATCSTISAFIRRGLRPLTPRAWRRSLPPTDRAKCAFWPQLPVR